MTPFEKLSFVRPPTSDPHCYTFLEKIFGKQPLKKHFKIWL